MISYPPLSKYCWRSSQNLDFKNFLEVFRLTFIKTMIQLWLQNDQIATTLRVLVAS